VTADEAAATVGVESRSADDRVGRQIEARSMIITAREGPLDASFRPVSKGPTVSTVIHDVETKIHKLQLIRERHSAVQQIKVKECECLDFVPTEFVDVKLNKIGASSPDPLNQRM
jgi:hypothetical protein